MVAGVSEASSGSGRRAAEDSTFGNQSLRDERPGASRAGNQAAADAYFASNISAELEWMFPYACW